jgi:hypothetical protein
MMEVVGREILQACDGTVQLIQVLGGYSATSITRQMMQSGRVDCAKSKGTTLNGIPAIREIS